MPLVATMAALCHAHSTVILAYQSRSSAADTALFAALQQHFTWSGVVLITVADLYRHAVDGGAQHPLFRSPDRIAIYVLHPR